MKLLSICIPTYNRRKYLEELLEMLLPQVEGRDEIEICVSDNKSTDDTAVYLDSLRASNLRFWTNESNIGGDRNFLRCIAEAKGEYVWLLGDDDLVPEGAIAAVLKALKGEHPDLLVSMNCEGMSSYDGYRLFLDKFCCKSSAVALDHTLISANIFRRTAFDLRFAEAKLYTQYAHMFGLVKNLTGKVVVVSEFVCTRPVRAEFAKYPNFLCVKQALYLNYLARRFNVPRFRWYAFKNACNLPLEFASRIKCRVLRIIRGA